MSTLNYLYNYMGKKIIFISMLLLVAALPVSAAEVAAGEEYFLSEGQIIEGNLYTAAGYVDISGTVEGDLITVGGSVIITGEIQEDLIAAGGDVDIWGNVGGDLRVAGGNVMIGGDVGGDLLIAGGMVQIRPNVTVNGDVIMAGGAIVMAGSIQGDVKMAGGDIVMVGGYNGDINVYYDESLEIREPTTIAGDFKYHGIKEIEIPTEVVIDGELMYVKPEIKAPEIKNIIPDRKVEPWGVIITGLLLLIAIKVIITMVVALFGVLAFQKRSQELVEHAVKNFGWELLRGFLVFILAPVLIFMLLISMVGILAGAIVAMIYGIIYCVAMVYTGVILGALIFKLLSKKKSYTVTWQSALIGILVLQFIKLIPIVGWIFCIVLFLVSLGALVNRSYHYFWLKRAK